MKPLDLDLTAPTPAVAKASDMPTSSRKGHGATYVDDSPASGRFGMLFADVDMPRMLPFVAVRRHPLLQVR